jgi:hypothetical protein
VGQLERLFLGSMLLVGLLILFLFGLYFDIGDMVAGTFKGNAVGFGQDQAMITRRRRASYKEKKPARSAPRLHHSGAGGGSTRPPNYRRYITSLPRIPRDTLIDREVRRLQRKGFVDEEFIRMRAIYTIDRSLIPFFDRYDQLMDAGDHQGAIDVLLEALAGVEEKNLLGKRDILRYLYQAYIMGGEDTQATRRFEELTLLHERIVAIEERAELHKDAASQRYLTKMRSGFGKLREAMTALKGNTGLEKKTWGMIRDLQQGKSTVVDERMLQGVKALTLKSSGDTEGRRAAKELLKKFQAGDYSVEDFKN